MKRYLFVVVVEKDEDGYYAFCPQLQGCYTQGDTFEEVMDDIRDAIKLHVEDRLAENEPVPEAPLVSVSSIEIAI